MFCLTQAKGDPGVLDKAKIPLLYFRKKVNPNPDPVVLFRLSKPNSNALRQTNSIDVAQVIRSKINLLYFFRTFVSSKLGFSHENFSVSQGFYSTVVSPNRAT